MKKRIGSLLLILALCLTLLPTAALAEDTTAMPAYSGGNGTKDDPWLISSVEDLQLLANTINDGKATGFDADAAADGKGVAGNYYGYYFRQTTNLDLNGIENWDPIGYSGGQDLYFAGHYDGDGHTISNAKSTGKNDDEGFATAGIFGWVAFGSVENLHVKNANFVATGQNNYSYVGGIAGVCYGSSIKNCSVVNSSLESKRNNNNNCAGSIVGYSTSGTFEKCAAENNQVKTMAYGGGFVGEVDDDPDYGAGKSTFTNCYTANCSVSSKTDDVQGASLVGGFVGEMTDSALTVNNCYVYRAMLSTEGTAVPGDKGTGVFAGNLWGGSSIADTNCFFGACGTTENAGKAGEKTEEEFTNGTVVSLLGEAFAQAGNYPRFKDSPADYSAVDAAIAKANALKKDDYKDFSAVETAVNDVARGKNFTEQGEVDAMAQAIEKAIAALQYKDADYTKVDEAIAKAKALKKDDYKDFTAVEAAVNAVVRDKNITEQAEVDAMAKAIEDAIATLVKKPSSGGDSSSGGGTTGGGSSSSSKPSASTGKTETVTKPDGTKVQTETKADGTKIQTTTGKDGSVTKTETKKDGSSVTENKAADGSTGTVKTDKNGQTEANAKVSAKAVEAAKKSGEAVKAPVEVEASRNSGAAPTVKVELPGNAGKTEVEIPVSNANAGTVAVLVHPDGTEEILKASVPTENGIRLTVDGSATVKIVDNAKGFIDTQNHWAKDEIDFVSARELVNGISATRYAPDATATRAQMWTILARQNDADLSGGANWYEKAQLWSKDKGISDGTQPDATITRAQMVTMLWRTMGQPAAGGAANFNDVPANSYYAQAVAWAVEGGITTGVGNGRFDPNSTCTRAQIATFLYRLYLSR